MRQQPSARARSNQPSASVSPANSRSQPPKAPSKSTHPTSSTQKLPFLCQLFLCIFFCLVLLLLYRVFQNESSSELSNSISPGENKQNDNEQMALTIPDLSKTSTSSNIPNEPLQVANTKYNRTLAMETRLNYISPVYPKAEPSLVGLGAEKSGSTSIGDAIYKTGKRTQLYGPRPCL